MSGALLLGLLSGLTWGVGDFLGGLNARRLSLLTVTFWSQLIGGVGLLVILLLLGQPPEPASVGWGVVAGIVGLGALLCFYRGLAIGVMSLVAPLSAGGALVPVTVDLLSGTPVGPVAVAGMLATLAGIVLVSMQPKAGSDLGRHTRATVLLGLGAALGFGIVLVLMDRGAAGGQQAALWTVVGARAGAVVVQAPIVLLLRRRLTWPGRRLGGVAAVGLFDTAGNAAFALAAALGDLGVAAVLASLYPVTTVLLGRLVLGERLARFQQVGVALALGGVGLLAAG
ncbi:MAG: EamA family transporter [Chloroflexi bacterium]|nr:EamA family transporter [Chloroflexota bacterium]